jgi:hypothetical protein
MDPPVILVLQPPKAASMAWYQALRSACPEQKVYHVHHINPRVVAEMRARRHVEGERQTIRNRAMIRQAAGLPDPSLEQAIAETRDRRRSVKIVSTVRDPVARAMSVLFYYGDFWGHRTLPLSHREGATVEGLTDFFVASWRRALTGEPAKGTFEEAFQAELVNHTDWFDRELAEILSLDVASAAFDFNRHVLVASSPMADLIVCRYEDLDPDNPALSGILDAVSRLVGTRLDGLPQSNSTSGRRSRDLYQAFRERLKLPTDILDGIYAAPILSKFYRPEEIGQMRARWAP